MNIEQMVVEAVDLMTAGNFEKSERLLKKVLRKVPDHFDAIHASALVDIGKSQPGRGMKKLKKLQQDANPRQAKILVHSMGMAHKGMGDFEAAVDCFREVYNARPDAYEAGMNLATCLEQLERYEEAATTCRLLLGTFENDADAQYIAICCKYGTGDQQQALDEFLALATSCDLELAKYQRICDRLEHHYRYEDLRKLASLALEKYPDAVPLAVFIARCDLEEKDYKNAVQRLEALAGSKQPAEVSAHLYHEIGLLHDKSGDYEAAYRAFIRSNEHQRHQYRTSRIKKFRSVEPYGPLLEDPAFVESWQREPRRSAGKDLCFLVGFPRSGTTLLERVLDSHSQIRALPELDFTAKLIESLGGIEKYQARLPTLEENELQELDDAYREALSQVPEPEGMQLTVDKLPLNLIHAPLVHRVFPEASFILALRHPADCSLSSFTQHFGLNGEMAHLLSLEEATQRYADVFGLWNHFQEILELNVHPIRYEDVVADFEAEVSKLMSFLGLPYETKQASYHEDAVEKGGVLTPSYRQVSKPIYKSSSYRWKNYEFAMAEHLPVLQPFIEQFGYAE